MLERDGSRIRQAERKEDEERAEDKEKIEWLIKQNEQKEAALKRKDQEIEPLKEEIMRKDRKIKEQAKVISDL